MIRSELRNIRQSIKFFKKYHYSIELANNFIKYFDIWRSNIGSYCAISEEISPYFIDKFLITQYNVLYYPIIDIFNGHQYLLFAQNDGCWLKNKYQIFEPCVNVVNNTINVMFLDFVIVPLLGFDENKHRLGMGQGYYDRSFNFKKKFYCTPILIGVAYDEQQLSRISIHDYDVSMDYIVTPSRIIY